jgi:hypothetical protein
MKTSYESNWWRNKTNRLTITWVTNMVFYLICLWGSHIGNHPQEELTKFDYRLQNQLEKIRILLYFNDLEPNMYCLTMEISKRSPQNLVTLALFFHKSPLYELDWIFFGHKMMKIHHEKMLVTTSHIYIYILHIFGTYFVFFRCESWNLLVCFQW